MVGCGGKAVGCCHVLSCFGLSASTHLVGFAGYWHELNAWTCPLADQQNRGKSLAIWQPQL